MLSVLSSGTLHLNKELSHARDEAYRLIGEKSEVLDILERRRRRFHKHMGTVAQLHADAAEYVLKKTAFVGLVSWRSKNQVWRRIPHPSGGARRSAWIWLWRRKLLTLWHRACQLSRREDLQVAHKRDVSACKVEINGLSDALSASKDKAEDLENLLACEKRRVSELEASLEQARKQISDLQDTLKDSYVRQFEEVQQRQSLEQKFSNLIGDMQKLRSERECLSLKLEQKRKEMETSEDLHHRREQRLHEASGELSLAEVVIDDITSSKCSGLRRFFEKYDLPGVVISLFRKTIELQSQIRSRSGAPLARSQSSVSNGCPSPLRSATPSQSSSAPLMAELRSVLSLHQDGAFSRLALHSYIESLRLTQVSTSMATQVLLAVLDIDLGEGPCDTSRFAAALSSPPAWESLELLTALWGAVGEPAAAIVQQRRRSQNRICNEFSVGSTPRKVLATSPRPRSRAR